ncbi:hypothetical protein MAR_021192 [Mya arenaria]|uniref:Uncharacterized protein n=1 Tax=Mya arenaria TaxID=6604 RepID=A0ABY7E6Z5_MYAAR|nr:hypothetical protein MAR_021192 [Mya arenaria]
MNIYENSDGVGTSGYQSTGRKTSPIKKNVNQDGLVYADLVFPNPPKGQKKLVIHGLDDMTEYAEVDLTKKADPLPDSDEEHTTGNKE